MIASIILVLLIVLLLIFIKPIMEGIKEGVTEAKEEATVEKNIQIEKNNEEWADFYTKNLNETEFFERFALALAQPYRSIFTNTELTELNKSCFSLKKLDKKQQTKLKSVIKRDFGVIDKQTLTNLEKVFAENIAELREKLHAEPDLEHLLANFTFSTPYQLKLQFGTVLGIPEKEKEKMQTFENNYHLGISGAEGFKIGILSYLYTSAYELDLINKYELKEYIEPLISEAQELFTTWDVYSESFKIGEYSARLTNALGRKGTELSIKDLLNDPYTPWQQTLWEESSH